MIIFIVASSPVMAIHCCIWFKQKSQLWGTLRGWFKVSMYKHLYLNDYAEFHSKISYIMFLHDYCLACEIAMVRPLLCSYLVFFRSLKKQLTHMLASLLENDKDKMWSFDRFFDEVKKLKEKVHIYVFNVCTLNILKIYIDPGARWENTCEASNMTCGIHDQPLYSDMLYNISEKQIKIVLDRWLWSISSPSIVTCSIISQKSKLR